MGATGSVGFYVDIDSVNHQAGDEIHGVVHMLVRKELPSTDVLLYLKGTEKTGWNEHIHDGESISFGTCRGKNRFLRQRYTLHTFPAPTIPVGQYCFPFSIQTPLGLRPSFRYVQMFSTKNCGKAFGKIEYELVAKLKKGPEGPEKGKCVINFMKPKPIIDIPFAGTASVIVSCDCLRKRGKVRVKARIDKSDFLPGETMKVSVDVNNEESKLKITSLTASIKREVRLQSDSGQDIFLRSTLNSSVIPVLIEAGKSSTDSHTLEVSLPADEKSACTLYGKLLHCRYTIEARANTSGTFMCFGQHATVVNEADVYSLEMKKEPPAVNIAWRPKELPMTAFVAGPENEYSNPDSDSQDADLPSDL